MADCANHAGTPAVAACTRCDTPICEPCSERLDGRRYCARCVAALKDKLNAPAAADPVGAPPPIAPEPAGVGAKAVVFAAGGGLLGAALWFAIVAASDYKLGIVAVGVGWLVGRGGLLGNGGRGGAALGLTCVAIAVGSMLVGEYLIVNHIVHKVLAEQKPDVVLPAFVSFSGFTAVYTKTFGVMDAVFYAIGAWEAWRPTARAR